MFTRTALLFAVLTQTAACVPIFDFKTPEKLTFDAPAPPLVQTHYADLMCCYDCTV